jgi:hypothetical protein
MKKQENALRWTRLRWNKVMYEIHMGAAANQGAAVSKPPTDKTGGLESAPP